MIVLHHTVKKYNLNVGGLKDYFKAPAGKDGSYLYGAKIDERERSHSRGCNQGGL